MSKQALIDEIKQYFQYLADYNERATRSGVIEIINKHIPDDSVVVPDKRTQGDSHFNSGWNAAVDAMLAAQIGGSE